MTWVRRLSNLLQALLPPIALFVLWWIATAHSTNIFYPPLDQILHRFRQDWLFARDRRDLEPSVVHFVAGLAIAVVAGVLVGIALGLSKRARRNLSPITEFLRATPFAALVPVGLVLFGPGATMEISLIAFASWWPVLLSTADGIRAVDPVLLDSARVYGVSPLRRIFRVALPAAAPRVFAGVRIAVAIAIAATVIANMFASNAGLGFFVVDAQGRFDVRDTWAGVLIIGILGLRANGAFLLIERRLLYWYRGWRASTTAS
jgi:sulfonate transport system permease protein